MTTLAQRSPYKKLLLQKRKLTGSEMRILRREAGVQQQKMAQLLSISQEHLSRMENEKTPVSFILDKFFRLIIAALYRDYELCQIIVWRREDTMP